MYEDDYSGTQAIGTHKLYQPSVIDVTEREKRKLLDNFENPDL